MCSMTLQPFTEQHFDLLIGWITNEDQLYLWSGPTYYYPLDANQLLKHCSKREVYPYLFLIGDQPVGFIELYKVSKRHFRICRVLISEHYQGQGLSKAMLRLILDKARTDFGALKVSLGVFEHNQVALHCYQKLGFKVVSVDRSSRVYKGKTWSLVGMEKSLIKEHIKALFQ